jgi:coproporphyrinogen III oxidase-like Fe-S oxidoreductase
MRNDIFFERSPMAEIALDKLLYRLLYGTPGRFRFSPGPVPSGEVMVPDPVSVYVHIPFCHSLCPFCPYTKTLYEVGLAAHYSRALEVEARRVLADLDGKKISSVYFGGGTPLTLLDSVESVLALMSGHLTSGAEVAVEVHPHDINPAAVERLASAGVNMVSLGVESLDNAVLAGIGRNHSAEDALSALHTLMDCGRFSINVDLMTAIPGQSRESAVSDMLMLMKSGVDQVSTYPLMDFAFTRMKTRLSLLEQYRLLRDLASAAEHAGYLRTSVWTWTKPGSRKYSSITREDYVGIGAGAASHLGRCFWVNTFDVGAYVDAVDGAHPGDCARGTVVVGDRSACSMERPAIAGDEPNGFTERAVITLNNLAGSDRIPAVAGDSLTVAEREAAVAEAADSERVSPVAVSILMDDRQSALYRLFWRCYEGEFDLDSREALAVPILRRLVRVAEALRLVARSSSTVRLTERGFFMYHLLERYYTRKYIGTLWRHCRESAFPREIVL